MTATQIQATRTRILHAYLARFARWAVVLVFALAIAQGAQAQTFTIKSDVITVQIDGHLSPSKMASLVPTRTNSVITFNDKTWEVTYVGTYKLHTTTGEMETFKNVSDLRKALRALLK